jgi:hypothetical protein
MSAGRAHQPHFIAFEAYTVSSTGPTIRDHRERSTKRSQALRRSIRTVARCGGDIMAEVVARS